ERMTRHYETILGALCSTIEARLGSLGLLSAPEREQIFSRWNATAADFEGWGTNVALRIREQANIQPDAIALNEGPRAIAYRELVLRADHLAQRLVALGVGVEHPVGVCIERSAAMVIAAVATLAIGAAYMPVDPNLPDERLAFMLDDVGVNVVLADSV